MLTRLHVRNFKALDDVSIELGPVTVLIGPNNSGKTSALQALALWEVGLREWLDKRGDKPTPEKRPGVTINRRDLIAVPVADANLLWKDLHVRSTQRRDGKSETQDVRIEILVEGVTAGDTWRCGFEFDYANSESLYCRPLRDSGGPMPIPNAVRATRIAFLPPMSGLAATEDFLQTGAINVRIGEGRTAEVLRNLCFRVADQDIDSWRDLCRLINELFGLQLNQPTYHIERGQISMSYRDRNGCILDLASAGRGLQQTLLLLSHLYVQSNSCLLLDEPDAHLEILRQRQIYQVLSSAAQTRGCQILAASHSEVILQEAADRDVVIAFVGKPHRIDDRGSQTTKALKSIGFDQYYQAELTCWVLYLEGSTDLAILSAFAQLLDHPAQPYLSKPFVHYAGNVQSKVREHFFGLREAKPDLRGIAIYDRSASPPSSSERLQQFEWSQREIENYLCFEETLLGFAGDVPIEEGSLFALARKEKQMQAMAEVVAEVRGALATLGKPDPFGPEIKASDEFLAPVFSKYYAKLGLENEMLKRDYHVLVRYVPVARIDPEISRMLDRIVDCATGLS